MQSSAEIYLYSANKDNSIRRHLRQCLMLLSLVVVLSVSWGLKLTGITMAGEAFCGKEEHTHSDECPLQTLICDLEESEAHMHTESCILRELICEEEEIPAHTHSKECLNKTFVCTLSETEGHTHDADCTKKELICQLAEEAAHFHEEGCYSQNQICLLEESAPHTHKDICYTTEITCGQEESELHTHGESCVSILLTCTMAETEGHTHSDVCYETHLSCPLEETKGHTHQADCYRELSGFICGLEEHPAHMHNEDCYLYEEDNFICGLEETEGHSHEDICYQFGVGFGCGLTEESGHVHVPECITPETQFGCEKDISEGHTHADSCYDILETCPLEEHIHDESCYSDINADIETSDDWEMTLANIQRSPSTAKNVLSVAQSQLGYTESILNFEVDENGVRRGITRYGQWYGNPYGDWSSMFTSFCLYYAGMDVPFNGGPEAMRLEWEKEGLFIPVQEYAPMVGHILFLDRTLDGEADATAIIEDYDVTTIFAIEGDVPLETEDILFDAVGRTKILMDDPTILGYGLIQDDAMMMVLPTGDTSVIATTIPYQSNIFTEEAVFVVYAVSGSNNYAFDGNGNAVPIYIDENGNISSDLENAETLLWSFTASGGSNTYLIQNVSTGRYMHAFPNNGSGVTTSGAYTSSLVTSGTGVKIRSNSEYARLDAGSGKYVMTQNQNLASVYYFGIRTTHTLWLDGTCGGVGYLSGSPDESYSLAEGEAFLLPETWPSPEKYNYRLRGWYDITNSRYYRPGEEITITENTVLYADWVANTYNIGQFNAHVADTVSTNSFITTHMFDYNYLFNIHSADVSGTVSAADHSETWSMVTSGTVDHGGQETFNFIFVDNDSGGRLTIPNNRSNHNVYPGSGIVTPGIYSAGLKNLLFSTSNIFDPETQSGILGKTYLGTGDHLFQIMDNPADEHYGYYYYDSQRNAASYNQSAGRFYVYDYLSATSDSIGGANSDFIPLNSPYANTNGKTVGTYSYSGVDGEYSGVTHYRFDSKYNSGNHNSTNNVSTDYAYGMRSDIKFYLPQDPGSNGNKDLNGNDMVFEFTGDDDLWILVDGQLVLDIGGIHGREAGTINFSSGQVTVQGKQSANLQDLGITAGDHTLTVLYLERGSSQSNCAIYFNLAPRFSLQIQKEDVLTQQLLDGTQFTIYEDLECTIPAELWDSEAAYMNGMPSKNTFTIVNGVANIWGFGSGNTYYIKETGSPNAEGYGLANGLIRLTIEKGGLAAYNVDVIADADGNAPSNGFTVHGVRIDENAKRMYIVVTNAPETVTETTTVQVLKKWEDDVSHSSDYITAYLTVTDPDGTVRRIREIVLGDENGWKYTWTNLPKYDYNAMTEVAYGIEESYESGYYSTVRRVTEIRIENVEWAEAVSFNNGESYLLKFNESQYLSASGGKLSWVSAETAKSSPNALWTATVSSGKVKLTNGIGQILTFNYSSSSSSRYFYTTTGSSSYQSFTPVDAGTGFRFYCTRSNRNYYMTTLNTSTGRISSSTSSGSGMILIPMKKVTEVDIQEVQDWAYQITNTPLEKSNETSMSVQKQWVTPGENDPTKYQEFQVTVRLLANGINTGRTMTLNLKNNWSGIFQGLPYTDENGNVIVYTVDEVWQKDNWVVTYGEIVTNEGTPPNYSTTITNTYYHGGPQLPSTGSAARLMYVLCGSSLMLAPLVYGIRLRRNQERRRK